MTSDANLGGSAVGQARPASTELSPVGTDQDSAGLNHGPVVLGEFKTRAEAVAGLPFVEDVLARGTDQS